MLKELKNDLTDKKILEEQLYSKETRKKYIIEKRLGLKATSLSECKLLLSGKQDKYAETFAKIEKLEKDIDNIKGELKIIADSLDKITKIMENSNIRVLDVFRCRYMIGLTQVETAERLHFSIDRIKQLDKIIKEKLEKK